MKKWYVYANNKYVGSVFARTLGSARRAAINQLGLDEDAEFSVSRK